MFDTNIKPIQNVKENMPVFDFLTVKKRYIIYKIFFFETFIKRIKLRNNFEKQTVEYKHLI